MITRAEALKVQDEERNVVHRWTTNNEDRQEIFKDATLYQTDRNSSNESKNGRIARH